MQYSVRKPDKDFIFTNIVITKGTRRKRVAWDRKENKIAIFKYEEYNCTESCSEKMSYEIAKVLDYPCAKIELAEDENGVIGILNYLFIDTKEAEHTDIIAYINKNHTDRKQFYTINNIKKCLDQLDNNLFAQFLKILVFDALIGETDRHEENWGIIIKNEHYYISPLYDNGCNLLREFKNEKLAEKYYSGKKNFNLYIERSKSLIYNETTGRRYTHFQLIKELYKEYPDIIRKEIVNIDNLTDAKIEKIVNSIPNQMMLDKQKEYIIKFIKIRKERLKEIINRGNL